jgi:hypothetical protein
MSPALGSTRRQQHQKVPQDVRLVKWKAVGSMLTSFGRPGESRFQAAARMLRAFVPAATVSALTAAILGWGWQ